VKVFRRKPSGSSRRRSCSSRDGLRDDRACNSYVLSDAFEQRSRTLPSADFAPYSISATREGLGLSGYGPCCQVPALIAPKEAAQRARGSALRPIRYVRCPPDLPQRHSLPLVPGTIVTFARTTLAAFPSPQARTTISKSLTKCSVVVAMRHLEVPPPNSPTWVMIASIGMVLCVLGFVLTQSGLI
jgi:hypothetical protein